MKNILLILLGCNIRSLLLNRVMTAIDFIENNKFNLNKITWYLTGGIKFDGEISEASIMKNELEKLLIHNNLMNIEYTYILDEKSKNTAENFYMASKYMNISDEKYDNIFIITSNFHHNRAKLMMSLIDSSRNYEWILGDMKYSDSEYWESVHIKNVYNDINNIYVNL